jgi:spermidine synthase
MAEKRWIAETLFDDLGFRMSYQVDKVLYEMQTEHQHLVLFEHPFFGKMLMLDGATQITKRDEFIYQEMMSHVPLFASPRSRSTPRSSSSPRSIFRSSPSRCSPTSVSRA